MKKIVSILIFLSFIFSLCSCGRAQTEPIDKDNPIRVQHAYAPYSNPKIVIADSFDGGLTYQHFEDNFESFQSGIILECEISGEAKLVKFNAEKTIDGIHYVEKGQGDYLSVVITPVKVLKVHHKSPDVETEINPGDIIPFVEEYFKVTEDMDEVTEEFEVGEFVSIEDYYPITKGNRYIIHGYVDEYKYRDIKYETALFSYGKYYPAVCLTENGLHAYRRELYTPGAMLQYVGTWLKYGEGNSFEYIYKDTINDDLGKINTKPIYNLSEDKTPDFMGVKEKNEYIKNLPEKNGAVFFCELVEPGKQVKNNSGIRSLSSYEYITKTKVRISGFHFLGENVKEEFEHYASEYYVYEPYFTVTNNMKELKEKHGENALITYSGYYPMVEIKEKTRPIEFFLYCTVEATDEGYVLVPINNSAATPRVEESRMDIPLNMQVQLGPVGVLNYLETYLYHCIGNNLI